MLNNLLQKLMPGTGKKKADKILIVDDEHAIRVLLQKRFELLGIKTEAFGTAEEALKKLDGKKGKFRLMVFDIMLPGEDGISLARSIREFDKRTPILLITGKFLPSQVNKLRDLIPNADIIAKPFDYNTFIRAVRKLGVELDTAA